jgi:hypothetical protein
VEQSEQMEGLMWKEKMSDERVQHYSLWIMKKKWCHGPQAAVFKQISQVITHYPCVAMVRRQVRHLSEACTRSVEVLRYAE